MHTRLSSLIIALAFVAASTSAAAAQVPAGFGIGGNIGYYTLSGDDFETTDAGFGFEGNGRYTLPGGFQIVGGVHYSIHNDDFLDENINVLGLFVDPRYVFNINSPNIAPFIGGRVAYLRESAEVDGIDFSATGFGFGGLGGLLIQLSPQVAIETTVAFVAVSFGDVEADDTTIEDSDTSGSSLALQGGVVFTFPR